MAICTEGVGPATEMGQGVAQLWLSRGRGCLLHLGPLPQGEGGASLEVGADEEPHTGPRSSAALGLV